MEKYAIFIDIDGTLCDDFPNGDSVSQENKNAIAKAREAGHFVFINTGRSYQWIPKYILDEVEIFDGVVSGMGTNIQIGKKTIFDRHIDEETADKILEMAVKTPFSWLFAGVDGVYTYRTTEFMKKASYTEITSKNFFAKNGAKIQKAEIFYEDFYQNGEKIETKADSALVQYLESQLDTFTHDWYIEAFPKGCSKSLAMLKTCEFLGVPQKNCIAIGDSPNDEDMLRAAGISVAMGNATDELKAFADFVSIPCMDSGVAYAIEKLVLKK